MFAYDEQIFRQVVLRRMKRQELINGIYWEFLFKAFLLDWLRRWVSLVNSDAGRMEAEKSEYTTFILNDVSIDTSFV